MRLTTFFVLVAGLLSGCVKHQKDVTGLQDIHVMSGTVFYVRSSVAQPASVVQPTPPAVSIVDQGVHVSWPALTNDSLLAYSVFYANANIPESYVFIPMVTNTQITIGGLKGGQSYVFQVAGYDTNGVQGEFSLPTFYRVPLWLDLAFRFDQPVTAMAVQRASTLMQWTDCEATPTNGVWRVFADPSVTSFYRARKTQ